MEGEDNDGKIFSHYLLPRGMNFGYGLSDAGVLAVMGGEIFYKLLYGLKVIIMEQLPTVKGEYLLEAPLEVLHHESMEWLDEIKFWRDEVAFFFRLLSHRTREGKLMQGPRLPEAERKLMSVSSRELDNLESEVLAHEKLLARIFNNRWRDEPFYRFRHRVIAAKIRTFEREYRIMKRRIFQLSIRTRTRPAPIFSSQKI